MIDQDLRLPEQTGDNLSITPPELGDTSEPESPGEEANSASLPSDPTPNEQNLCESAELGASVSAPVVQESGTQDAKPFVVALAQVATGRPNHFTPSATIAIAPALRTSGLLAALPAEEIKTLLCLLTFLSPNGDIVPTVGEIAEGLRVSENKARDRLTRLVRFRWQQRPVIATLWRESGLTAYTLSPEFISYRMTSEPARAPSGNYRVAGREAVIANSRAKYTRPRREVERQIAMMQGWPLPEEQESAEAGATRSDVPPEEYLRQRLFRIGVTLEQVEVLLASVPIEEIEAQLAWLPYRGAKNPASYLVAAITGHYAEPALLKLRREQGNMVGSSADIPELSEEAG